MSRVVTVDFDHTLAESSATQVGLLWSFHGELVPIPRVIKYVKQLISEGCDIHIVTFRSEKDKPEVVNFLHEQGIEVKSIVCTAGKTKTPYLLTLNTSLHIDDNIEVLTLAKMAGIKCLLVKWDHHDNNSTAKYFKTI